MAFYFALNIILVISWQHLAYKCMLFLVRSPARPIFFPRIDDSHRDRIPSSLTGVRCFDNGYVGKQPVGWKIYCAEYWLKELMESIDRCTGLRDITEILLKTALNTIQSINQSSCSSIPFSPLSILSTMVMWEAASGLERILCGVLVKRTPGKHGLVHWPPRYYWNNVENGAQSIK